MGQRGSGYGSEDHLRRLLTSENPQLNATVIKEIGESIGSGITGVEWHLNYLDDSLPELRGMDFLPEDKREQWKAYWPDRRSDPLRTGTPNWDAIGKLKL